MFNKSISLLISWVILLTSFNTVTVFAAENNVDTANAQNSQEISDNIKKHEAEVKAQDNGKNNKTSCSPIENAVTDYKKSNEIDNFKIDQDLDKIQAAVVNLKNATNGTKRKSDDSSAASNGGVFGTVAGGNSNRDTRNAIVAEATVTTVPAAQAALKAAYAKGTAAAQDFANAQLKRLNDISLKKQYNSDYAIYGYATDEFNNQDARLENKKGFANNNSNLEIMAYLGAAATKLKCKNDPDSEISKDGTLPKSYLLFKSAAAIYLSAEMNEASYYADQSKSCISNESFSNQEKEEICVLTAQEPSATDPKYDRWQYLNNIKTELQKKGAQFAIDCSKYGTQVSSVERAANMYDELFTQFCLKVNPTDPKLLSQCNIATDQILKNQEADQYGSRPKSREMALKLLQMAYDAAAQEEIIKHQNIQTAKMKIDSMKQAMSNAADSSSMFLMVIGVAMALMAILQATNYFGQNTPTIITIIGILAALYLLLGNTNNDSQDYAKKLADARLELAKAHHYGQLICNQNAAFAEKASMAQKFGSMLQESVKRRDNMGKCLKEGAFTVDTENPLDYKKDISVEAKNCLDNINNIDPSKDEKQKWEEWKPTTSNKVKFYNNFLDYLFPKTFAKGELFGVDPNLVTGGLGVVDNGNDSFTFFLNTRNLYFQDEALDLYNMNAHREPYNNSLQLGLPNVSNTGEVPPPPKPSQADLNFLQANALKKYYLEIEIPKLQTELDNLKASAKSLEASIAKLKAKKNYSDSYKKSLKKMTSSLYKINKKIKEVQPVLTAKEAQLKKITDVEEKLHAQQSNYSTFFSNKANSSQNGFDEAYGKKIDLNTVKDASGKLLEEQNKIGFPMVETRVLTIKRILFLLKSNLDSMNASLQSLFEQKERYNLLLGQMKKKFDVKTQGITDVLKPPMKPVCIAGASFSADPTCGCAETHTCASFKYPDFPVYSFKGSNIMKSFEFNANQNDPNFGSAGASALGETVQGALKINKQLDAAGKSLGISNFAKKVNQLKNNLNKSKKSSANLASNSTSSSGSRGKSSFDSSSDLFSSSGTKKSKLSKKNAGDSNSSSKYEYLSSTGKNGAYGSKFNYKQAAGQDFDLGSTGNSDGDQGQNINEKSSDKKDQAYYIPNVRNNRPEDMSKWSKGVHEDREFGIFKIISKRYKRTAYPRLLKIKKMY